MDIKETRELLIALIKVGKVVVKQLKDGVQPTDAIIILKELASQEIREDIIDAIAGSTLIPAELKDLDLEESTELIKTLIDSLVE